MLYHCIKYPPARQRTEQLPIVLLCQALIIFPAPAGPQCRMSPSQYLLMAPIYDSSFFKIHLLFSVSRENNGERIVGNSAHVQGFVVWTHMSSWCLSKRLRHFHYSPQTSSLFHNLLCLVLLSFTQLIVDHCRSTWQPQTTVLCAPDYSFNFFSCV